MENDPRADWVLYQNGRAKGGPPHSSDEELSSAARSAWPGVLAHARRELAQRHPGAETDALVIEVWEAVLESVSRALQRMGEKRSSVESLEGYLFAAFHHRFNRALKAEQRRRKTIGTVSSTADFDQIEDAHDTRWVSDMERSITVGQIISHMDEWTRKTWQARQYGYSWREISERLGLSEQNAKMRFRYGLEKTRKNLVKAIKRNISGWKHEE